MMPAANNPGGRKGRGESYLWLLAHKDYSNNECLIWPFSRIWNGYGHLGHEGKIKKAHRVMCQIVNGEPPIGHVAAHSCGNGSKGCVNPRHLSWKTPRENQLDRRVHGTSERRSKWSRTRKKLTPQQIEEVRALKSIKNQREIAASYGISYQQVSLIQRGLDRQPKRAS